MVGNAQKTLKLSCITLCSLPNHNINNKIPRRPVIKRKRKSSTFIITLAHLAFTNERRITGNEIIIVIISGIFLFCAVSGGISFNKTPSFKTNAVVSFSLVLSNPFIKKSGKNMLCLLLNGLSVFAPNKISIPNFVHGLPPCINNRAVNLCALFCLLQLGLVCVCRFYVIKNYIANTGGAVIK